MSLLASDPSIRLRLSYTAQHVSKNMLPKPSNNQSHKDDQISNVIYYSPLSNSHTEEVDKGIQAKRVYNSDVLE